MPGFLGAEGRGAIEQSIFGQLKDLGGRDVRAIGAEWSTVAGFLEVTGDFGGCTAQAEYLFVGAQAV